MGMTIDNSIAILVDYLEWQKLNKMDGTGIDEATRNLIGVARKYQKIEEVVNNWHHDIDAKDFECMAKIAEVVEDGMTVHDLREFDTYPSDDGKWELEE